MFSDFIDRGAMWRDSFQSQNLQKDVEKLWQEVKPLYESLHNYVRVKLKKFYKNAHFTNGLIPSHLLGNTFF